MAKKKRKRVDYDSLPMSIYNPEYQYLVRQNAQDNANVFYPGGELYGNGNGGTDWASMGQQNNGISVSNLGLTNPYSGMNQQNIGTPTGSYTDGLQTEYHRVNPIKYLSMSEPERMRQNELRKEAREARKAEDAQNPNNNGGGTNWGGVIGAAANATANAIHNGGSNAEIAANALGIPELAKVWTADTTYGDNKIKAAQNEISKVGNTNYIKDASSFNGVSKGLSANALKTPKLIDTSQFNLLNRNSKSDIKKFKGNWWKNMATAQLQGAASGSVGGPWGALGGALTGLFGSIGGLFGRKKRAQKAIDEYNRNMTALQSYANARNTQAKLDYNLANQNLIKNGTGQQNINEMANFRAYGGNLYPDGGTIEPYYPKSSDPDAVNWLSDWYRQRPNQVQNTFGNNHNLSFVQINPNMNETYYGETNVPKERKVDYNLLTYPTEEEYNKNLYKNLMDRAAASSNILSENMWEGAGGTYSVDGTHFVQNPNFDPHYNDWLMQQWKNGNYVEPEIDKNTPESMINGDNYKNTIMYNWNAMNDRNDSMSTRIHERTHSMVTDPLLNDIDNSLRDSINNRLQLNENIENNAYWDDPNEIYSRMNEFRYKSGLKGSDKVTKEFLNKNRKILEDKGLDRYTDESLLKLFNEIADNNNMSNYNNIAAMGGQFDINLSPNMMSLWSNKQNIDQMKAYNQQQTLGLGNSFNQPKLNTFDAGGDLYGNGYMLDENGNPIPMPKSLYAGKSGNGIYMSSGYKRKEDNEASLFGDKKTKWYGHNIYTNATPEEKEAFINGAKNVVIPYVENLPDVWYDRRGLDKDKIRQNAALFKEYINNIDNGAFDYNGNHYTVDLNDDNAREFYNTLHTIDPRFILEDNGFYETEKNKNGDIVRKIDENGNYIRLPEGQARPLFGGNVMSSIGSAVVNTGTFDKTVSEYVRKEHDLINDAFKNRKLPEFDFDKGEWQAHTTNDGYTVYSMGNRDARGRFVNGRNVVVGPDGTVYAMKAQKDKKDNAYIHGNGSELIPFEKADMDYVTLPYFANTDDINHYRDNGLVSIAWGNGTTLSSDLHKAQWPSFYQQTQPVQKAYGGNLNRFDFGGSMSGMDLPTNMQSYENGGTHEENPYGGIQVGVDGQGNPNLVEEGEFRWGDYVFSDRINVDPDILSMYNITGSKPKKKSKKQPSYADIAKKYADKNKELTNDPISKNSLNAYMDKLQKAQEDQKYQEQLQAQQDQQYADYTSALKNPTQGNPMYGSMKYNGMGNANQGVNAGVDEGMGNPMDNSDLSNVNRSGNAMMAAYGGNLFGDGGRPVLHGKTFPTKFNPYGDSQLGIIDSNNDINGYGLPIAGTQYLTYTGLVDYPTRDNNEPSIYNLNPPKTQNLGDASAYGYNTATKDDYNKLNIDVPFNPSGMVGNVGYSQLPFNRPELAGINTNFNPITNPTAAQKQQLLVNNGYNLGSTGFYGDGVDNVWGKKSQEAWNDFTGNKYGSTQGNQNQTPPNGSKTYNSYSTSAGYSGVNKEMLKDYEDKNSYESSNGSFNTKIINGTTPQLPVETRGELEKKQADLAGYTPIDFNRYNEFGRYGQLAKGLMPNLMNWAGQTNWNYNPDWRPSNSLEALGHGSYASRTADHLGDYIAPNLMDVERLNNQAMAQTAAQQRGIQNVSGGNRGFVGAQSAATDYNGQMGIGNNYATTEQYNADQKQRAADFNRATNQFNAQANNDMYRDNLNAWMQGHQMDIQAMEAANRERQFERQYKDRTDRDAALNKQQDLAAMFDNQMNFLADESKYNRDLNMLNSRRNNRYYYDKKDGWQYRGDSGYTSDLNNYIRENGVVLTEDDYAQLKKLDDDYGFDNKSKADKLAAAQSIINRRKEIQDKELAYKTAKEDEDLKFKAGKASEIQSNLSALQDDKGNNVYGNLVGNGLYGKYAGRDLYDEYKKGKISAQELNYYIKAMDDIEKQYNNYHFSNYNNKGNTPKAYGGKLNTKKRRDYDYMKV